MNEIVKKHNSSKVLSKFEGCKWDKQYLKKLLEIKRAGEHGYHYVDQDNVARQIDNNYFPFIERVEEEKDPVIKGIMKKFKIQNHEVKPVLSSELHIKAKQKGGELNQQFIEK